MISKERNQELLITAAEIRKDTLRAIASVGIGHIGGSLSVADLLASLYFEVMNIDPKNPKWPERDRLVMSKGHCGPAVYSALAMRGYFDRELLFTLNKPGTMLPSHCDIRRTPGIDMTTGSLGQGISSALGIAYANRLDRRESYVYFVIGDGECQEGQVWEASLFAGHRSLDHVIGFLDYNGLQIDGTVDDICSLGDPAGKFQQFGWHTQTIDGHSPAEICNAVDEAKKAKGKPSMIILKTLKGKGVSAFENKLTSHNAVVNHEILTQGLYELNQQIKEAAI